MKATIVCSLLLLTSVISGQHFSAKTSYYGNVGFDGKPVTVTLVFENRGTFSGKAEEVIRLSDFRGLTHDLKRREVAFDGKARFEHEITVPAGFNDMFALRYSLIQNNAVIFSDETTGAVLTPIACLNPETSPLGILCWSVSSYPKQVPFVKNLGIPWVRTLINWRFFEPKQGERNWGPTDKAMKVLEENEMNIMATLGHTASWAHNLYRYPGGWQLFADHAARCVERYPKVKVWEVWNEADYQTDVFGPRPGEGFAEMLKAAYPAMKKANPKALIAIGGLTGGNEAEKRLSPFYEQVTAAGGLPYFDMINIHYRHFNEYHRQLRNRFGWNDKITWNSEDSNSGTVPYSFERNTFEGLDTGVVKNFYFLFYITSKTRSTQEEFDSSKVLDNRHQPTRNLMPLYTHSKMINGYEYAGREKSENYRIFKLKNREGKTLIALWGTGNRRTAAIKTAEPVTAYDFDGVRHELSPHDGLVGVPAAQLTYLAGDVQVTGGEGMIAFANPKQPLIFGEPTEITLDLRNPGGSVFRGEVRLRASSDWPKHADAAKVELKPGASAAVTLRLTPRPLTDDAKGYVVAELVDPSGKTVAADALYATLTLPLNFKLLPSFRGEVPIAAAVISNPGGNRAKGKLTFSTPEGREPAVREFTVPPGKSAQVEFAPNFSGREGTVNASLEINGVTVSASEKLEWLSIPANPEAALDSPFDTPSLPIRLETRDTFKSTSNVLWRWDGPKDLSVAARTDWNADHFWLSAVVTDDIHVHPQKEPHWGSDSMQISFNGSMYILALTSMGAGLAGEQGASTAGIVYSVERQDTRTRYRIGFPPPAGKKWRNGDLVRFAFIVNDADENGERRGWMFYRTDLGNTMERSQVKTFILTGDPAHRQPTPENLPHAMNPANWKANCAGRKMSVSYDAGEEALCFKGTFLPEVKNRWFYPIYQLSAADRRAKFISFEVKAVQTPAGVGFKNAFFWFSKPGDKSRLTIPYPLPENSDQYRKVKIDLSKQRGGIDLSQVESMYFGADNREASELTILLKNLQFAEQ